MIANVSPRIHMEDGTTLAELRKRTKLATLDRILRVRFLRFSGKMLKQYFGGKSTNLVCAFDPSTDRKTTAKELGFGGRFQKDCDAHLETMSESQKEKFRNMMGTRRQVQSELGGEKLNLTSKGYFRIVESELWSEFVGETHRERVRN